MKQHPLLELLDIVLQQCAYHHDYPTYTSGGIHTPVVNMPLDFDGSIRLGKAQRILLHKEFGGMNKYKEYPIIFTDEESEVSVVLHKNESDAG